MLSKQNRPHWKSGRLLAAGFMYLLSHGLITTSDTQAALTFTVTDNGNNTTDWTISGSGTTGNSLANGNNNSIAMNAYTTQGATTSTSGTWSFNGHNSDFEQAGDSFGNDFVNLGFDTDITAGESLAGASGTVTFAIPFSSLTLPATSQANDAVFGAITIVAVPEPSTVLSGAIFSAFGLALFVRKRKAKNL